MSALDNLPPDQRAVLQMVLQRGRSYDEIASLLSIDRGAVRQRALAAFDALAPATVLPGPESALVTDYLLGQLPARVAEQVYSYLEASESDREWAQAVSAAVAPLASGALPEIPLGAPLGADQGPSGGLEHPRDPSLHPGAAPDEAPPPAAPGLDSLSEPARGSASPAPTAADPWAGAARARTARERPASSRRGGAILLGGVGAAILAVIAIALLSSGGNGKQHSGTSARTVSTPVSTPQSVSTSTTTATQTTSPSESLLTQLNLTSPTGAKATVGIVQVVRVGSVLGMIMRAQGMPANTAHNAYAVWLYNSPSSYKFVGFVQYLVGKNGLIDTEGKLPAGAAAYHHLLITLETQQKPAAPGEVVLSGPFREHS